MGYFVPNILGDLVTVSNNPVDDGIVYQDDVLFNAILQAPYNYKWNGSQILFRPDLIRITHGMVRRGRLVKNSWMMPETPYGRK